MTTDEILGLAPAEMQLHNSPEELITFARLVEARVREECAKLCEAEEVRIDSLHDIVGGDSLYLGGKGIAAGRCARLIRAQPNGSTL